MLEVQSKSGGLSVAPVVVIPAFLSREYLYHNFKVILKSI